MMTLHLFAASGVELRTEAVRRARQRLASLGFEVSEIGRAHV